MPMNPPPPFFVSIIQVAKTQESEESTCSNFFPVLDNYILHLERASAVHHVPVRNQRPCEYTRPLIDSHVRRGEIRDHRIVSWHSPDGVAACAITYGVFFENVQTSKASQLFSALRRQVRSVLYLI